MSERRVTPVPAALVVQVRPALAATHGTTAEDGHRDHGAAIPAVPRPGRGHLDAMPRALRRTPTCSTSWVRSGPCRHRSRTPPSWPRSASGCSRRPRPCWWPPRRSRPTTDERLRLRPAAPRTRRRNRRLAAGLSGVDPRRWRPATMAVAAQSALPGDGLYPLKRGLESAHAQLTFDRAARGRVLLDSASTRLDEVAELSRTGGSADQRRPDPRRLHPGGGRWLRPADRGLPGDRRPVVDHHASAPSPRRAWRGCVCSRARSRPAPSTSCSRRPRRSTRCSRSRRTPVPAAPGRRSPRCRSVLTQAVEAAARLLAGRPLRRAPGRTTTRAPPPAA